MVAKIIDGKAIAAKMRSDIKKCILSNQKKQIPTPRLAVILIGTDPASAVYVRNKHQACQEVGIESMDYSLPKRVSQKTLLELIQKLNNDPKINGILLQLPLPKHLDGEEALEAICPSKDVDGFHSMNLGRLALHQPGLHPCTPLGVMLMLEAIKQKYQGKEAVIVGASNIVGKPMALELLSAGSTVTICHRHTKDLAKHVMQADILVSAVGKPGLIKAKWIKKGATVVDVGITLMASGKLRGDVEFEGAAKKAKWITPVPGGVGPMTVAVLLRNTLMAQGFQLGVKRKIK